MIEFSEDYNAQTIFDQVWEYHYEWFALPEDSNGQLPCKVLEMDPDMGDTVEAEYEVTVEKIEAATLSYYFDYVAKRPNCVALADYLSDFDANDVDCILQLACFGEIRYS